MRAIEIVLTVLIFFVLVAVAIETGEKMAKAREFTTVECEKLRIKTKVPTSSLSVTQEVYNACQDIGVPLEGVTIRAE